MNKSKLTHEEIVIRLSLLYLLISIILLFTCFFIENNIFYIIIFATSFLTIINSFILLHSFLKNDK